MCESPYFPRCLDVELCELQARIGCQLRDELCVVRFKQRPASFPLSLDLQRRGRISQHSRSESGAIVIRVSPQLHSLDLDLPAWPG